MVTKPFLWISNLHTCKVHTDLISSTQVPIYGIHSMFGIPYSNSYFTIYVIYTIFIGLLIISHEPQYKMHIGYGNLQCE